MSGIINSADLTAIITNLGIFSLAIAAAVGGAWQGIKKIKKESAASEPGKVLAASMIETTTLLMWSESNRDVVAGLDKLGDDMKELRHELELHRLTRGPIP